MIFHNIKAIKNIVYHPIKKTPDDHLGNRGERVRGYTFKNLICSQSFIGVWGIIKYKFRVFLIFFVRERRKKSRKKINIEKIRQKRKENRIIILTYIKLCSK